MSMGEKDEKQYFLKKPDGEYCPITDITECIVTDQDDNSLNFSETESVTINFRFSSNTKKILFWTIVAPGKIKRNNFRKNHGIPKMRRVAGRKGVRKKEYQISI